MINPKFPFLEIVEWTEHDPNIMMWKIPDQDHEIKNGARLIVRESQVAMFLNEGKIADIFAPGTHTLTTENIPVLSRLKGWKYGFESPFKADIYFFSVKQFVNLKWGTPAPIMMRDPHFGQVRVRGFGTYNVRISDITKFFKEYAGSFHQLTIVEFERQLKDYIAPKFGEVLSNSDFSVMDVARNLSLMNERIAPLVKPYFDDFGIEITQFALSSATLPEEVNQYYDKVTGMNMMGDMDRFRQFNTAIAISQPGNVAEQGLQQGLAMGIMLNQVNSVHSKSETKSDASPADNKAGAPVSGNSNARDQLIALKALFDDGLIDEQEFKAKKAEIMTKF